MNFEHTDYFNGDARYKTVIDGETIFINITEEALEDDLKEGLTPDKKTKLGKIVNARLTSGQLVRLLDKVSVPYEVILIRTGDLA